MNDLLKITKKRLKTAAVKEDFENIVTNLKKFEDALGPDNKKIKDLEMLDKLKSELFEYEKKYLPSFEENRQVLLQLKPDVLLLTVGFQAEPIILSILCLKPREVYLLHSEGSRKIAQKVEKDHCIKSKATKFYFKEISEVESRKNYEVIKGIISNLSKKSRIVVDPTGGRKVMVSSLALVAFYCRLPMVYLQGVEKKQKIMPFSEKLRIIENPLEYFGDADLKITETLFNSHMYEAAFKMCLELLKSVRDLDTAKRIELLSELISIYRDWDAFLHSSFDENYPKSGKTKTLSERLERVIQEFNKFGINKWLPQNVQKNLDFLKYVDSTWKNKLNIVDKYRLVDIFLNARRRGSEKQAKYDDAVARLYRCLEMSSTYVLQKNYGLTSTEKPNYGNIAFKSRLSERQLRKKFFKIAKYELPDSNLALDNQMKLLEALDKGSTVVKVYKEMEKSGLIKMRNRSILAHGSRPCTETDWSQFREKTKVIIENVIGKEDFNLLYEMAKHGFIDLSRI